MNSYSSFNIIFRNSGPDINSISYVNTLAKNVVVDICGGTSFSNLAGISSYSINARGINPGNQGNTYLGIKNSGGNVLQTSNFATTSSNSFTFYVKSASRFNTNPILGHGYALTTNAVYGNLIVANTLTITYYTLYPKPSTYIISGTVLSTDLSDAPLSGNVDSNYLSFGYELTHTTSKTFNFSIGSITKPFKLCYGTTIYTVTVLGGVFYLNGSKSPNVNFLLNNVYIFDQSDTTNTNNTLVVGTSVDVSSSIVNTNVVTNGTTGSTNAYTLVDMSEAATLLLYYFSSTTIGMGYIPPSIRLVGNEAPILQGSTNLYNWVKVIGTGTVSFNINNLTLYYIVVGGGGGGGSSQGSINLKRGMGGGGGGGFTADYIYPSFSGSPIFNCDKLGSGGYYSEFGTETSLTCNLPIFRYSRNNITAGGGNNGSFPASDSNYLDWGGNSGNPKLNYIPTTICTVIYNAGNGRTSETPPTSHVSINLGSQIFYFCSGGGGGSAATNGSSTTAIPTSGGGISIYGSGYGGQLDWAAASNASANSGGGGGGDRPSISALRSDVKTRGGSGCVFFFWAK